MSDFLKFAYELIAQIVYNLTAWIVAIIQGFIRLFITGWGEYYAIFTSYFGEFGFLSKILSIILVILLIAIPIVAVIIIVRHIVLHIQLKADQDDNRTL